jgi:hypothetical protein
MQKVDWMQATVGAAYPNMLVIGIVYYILMKLFNKPVTNPQ